MSPQMNFAEGFVIFFILVATIRLIFLKMKADHERKEEAKKDTTRNYRQLNDGEYHRTNQYLFIQMPDGSYINMN